MERDSAAVMWFAIALGAFITVVRGVPDDLCGLVMVGLLVWAVYKYFRR